MNVPWLNRLRHKHRISLAVTALLCCIAPGIPWTAAAGGPGIASVSLSPGGIQWSPHSTYEQINLTISGPDGLVITKTFGTGEAPVFTVNSSDTAPLPDGNYNYELTVVHVIDADTKAQMAAARESGDMSVVEQLRNAGKLPVGPTRQGGHFTIRNGMLRNNENMLEEN